MKNNPVFVFPVAALLTMIVFGCASTPPAVVPDTRAAEAQAIRDGEAGWVKDFATKDPDKVLMHYTDDSDSMLPDMKLMAGHDAIRSGLKEEFSDPNAKLDFHPAKVEVAKSGEMAYSQGTYMYTSTDPKTKKTVIEHGNYVEVYRRQPDGSWKSAEDIAVREAPPVPVK